MECLCMRSRHTALLSNICTPVQILHETIQQLLLLPAGKFFLKNDGVVAASVSIDIALQPKSQNILTNRFLL